MNWGYAYTKQGFLHTFTRGQYERLNIASPLSKAFFVQIGLFVRALLSQFSPPVGSEHDYLLGLPLLALAIVGLCMLAMCWKDFNHRARAWLIFVWVAFFITSM